MTDLNVSDLTVEYATADYMVRPVDGLDLRADSGHMVLLLGPSGSGKTTILSCLAGILSPSRGRIEVAGVSVGDLAGEELARYRRDTVGIVFQAFNLIPSLTALENVELGLRMAGRPRGESREKARALLERFGLADRLRNRPGQLSGGQQQRVAIARALVHDPPLVLADEPTANLDYVQAESVINVIRELAAPGRLVVIATHDERMIPLADQVVELAPNFRNLTRPPEHVELAAGQVLFDQGDPGELIYAIEEGRLEIVRVHPDGTEQLLTVLGPGEYFGEIGPLFGLPRTATARAGTAAAVTGYTVRDFRKMFGGDPRLAKLLARASGDGEAAPPASGAPAAAGAPASRGGPPGHGTFDDVRRAARGLGLAVRRWLG